MAFRLGGNIISRTPFRETGRNWFLENTEPIGIWPGTDSNKKNIERVGAILIGFEKLPG
jgi:hypothetical protein